MLAKAGLGAVSDRGGTGLAYGTPLGLALSFMTFFQLVLSSFHPLHFPRYH